MESTGKKKKLSESSTVLAPGFRFHPTDEELVRYYLRRKVWGKSFLRDAISEIDIYKAEPWDLPRCIVLCRVFQKSGPGPKNGEQYGAPFVVEEWEDEQLESVPEKDVSEEVEFGGDFCLDGHDLEQILGCNVPSHITTPPLNVQSADGSHGAETTASFSDTEKLLVGADEQLFCEPEPFDGTNLYDLLVPNDINVNLVKHECIGESSKSGNPEEADYLLDEPFLDSSEYFPFGEEGFIETNDLSNPVEANTADFEMLEEYLTFFDASNDSYQYFSYDPSIILSEDDSVSAQTFRPQKEPNEGTEQAVIPGGLITDYSNVDAASSSHKQVAAKYQSDLQYPFIKQASQMLSNIPAKPAFASECPSKDSTVHFNLHTLLQMQCMLQLA